MNTLTQLSIDSNALTIGRRSSGAPLYHRKSQFGEPLRCNLDRNARARLLFLAEAIERRTRTPRAHGGIFKLKGLQVLRTIVMRFYNLKKGTCFPSIEEIAREAGCAPSTVSAKLRMLEAYKLIFTTRRKMLVEFVSRQHRARYTVAVQTSNSYTFPTHITGTPTMPPPSKKRGTASLPSGAEAPERDPRQAELELWPETSRRYIIGRGTQLLREKLCGEGQP